MFQKACLLFFCVFISFAFFPPNRAEKKANKVISKFYETDGFSKNKITFSEEIQLQLKSDFSQGNLFEILENDKFLGYGYMGNAKSKTATFDYLVLFDSEFIITKSTVLIYREEYGGEISSKRWLKQFIGKDSSSELIYNNNIIPISGATISVKSMTIAVNDLLSSLAQLQDLKLI
ncbi:MAG: FMN-binding protein [Flavobacteriaceae bacterium]|nr:FMN-binding protein [Flavobacteriaceae bacterium]